MQATVYTALHGAKAVLGHSSTHVLSYRGAGNPFGSGQLLHGLNELSVINSYNKWVLMLGGLWPDNPMYSLPKIVKRIWVGTMAF